MENLNELKSIAYACAKMAALEASKVYADPNYSKRELMEIGSRSGIAAGKQLYIQLMKDGVDRYPFPTMRVSTAARQGAMDAIIELEERMEAPTQPKLPDCEDDDDFVWLDEQPVDVPMPWDKEAEIAVWQQLMGVEK